MKKIVSLLLLFVIVALLCACSPEVNTDVHNHDHSHTEEVTDSLQDITEDVTSPQAETLPEVHTSDATGPLTSKHSRKIDVPFDSEYSGARSDAEKIAVCDKYREEWAKIAKRYINELLNYNGDVPVHADFSTDKELHEFVEFRKVDFETFFDSDSKSYLAQMEEQYGKGDKADALCAKYMFDLQRAYALEMIEIYELLGEFNGQVF